MENEELVRLISEADDHYVRGRIDQAFDLYSIVLEQDPSVAWAYNRIGAILAQRDQLDAAEEALQKALELNPELPQAHSNLGNIHYTRGEYDAAIERYQTAAKLDPANPLYHENLHAAYKKQKKFTEAVKALKHSHKLVRENSSKETRTQFQAVKRRFGCTSVIAALALLAGAAILMVSAF